MSFSVISFILWVVFMLGLMGGLIHKGRKSRSIQRRTEDIAHDALPKIGGIAEEKHKQRFGCAPPDAPDSKDAWYPEVKKRVAKAGG